MKKIYFNPEAMIFTITDEDILTSSPLTTSTNLLGDDDGELFSQMFQ